MKTYQKVYLRAFPVSRKDERTGEITEDVIVFTKDQLRATQLARESSKELIHRTYNREGYTVLDIGKARKVEVTLDLDKLVEEAGA